MQIIASGKGCSSHKIKYASRGAARRAARYVQQYIGRTQAYRCEFCGWYHIGHPKGTKYA